MLFGYSDESWYSSWAIVTGMKEWVLSVMELSVQKRLRPAKKDRLRIDFISFKF